MILEVYDVTKPIRTLACGMALILLLLVGCAEDTVEESPDGKDKPPAGTEGGTNTTGGQTGTESPDTPGWGGIEGVPPPKLVDVRQVEENYEDGARRSRYRVKFFSDESTVKHGDYTEWYPDGSELCRGRYSDDKKDGEWTYWSPSGKKAKNGSYQNGRLDGPWVYYDDEEKPAREENYKNGVKHGPQIMFYDNGVEKQRIEFADGKPDGTAVLRDEDGNETGRLIYEDGKLVERVTPDSS